MLEDVTINLRELKSDLEKHFDSDSASFDKREQSHDINMIAIKMLGEERSLDSKVRRLTGFVANFENDIMVINSSNLLVRNDLMRLELLVEMSLLKITKELEKIKQPSSLANEEDKEKIINIEKEIVNLTRTAEKWKPLMSNLEEGIKRTKKVLRKNR